MLTHTQKHTDSILVHGSHKSDSADGVKRTLVAGALILNVATYPQASRRGAQPIKRKNPS